MKNLVSELWKKNLEPSKHYVDNKGLINKLKKFGCNSKTRHIDIKTKAIREELMRESLVIDLIPSEKMNADGLTKALSPALLANLITLINPKFSVVSSHTRHGGC